MRVALLAMLLAVVATAAGSDSMSVLYVRNTKFLGHFDRACRVDGTRGDYVSDTNVSRETCQKECEKDRDCKGYEYTEDTDFCEYHEKSGLPYRDEKDGAFSGIKDGHECFWKASSDEVREDSDCDPPSFRAAQVCHVSNKLKSSWCRDCCAELCSACDDEGQCVDECIEDANDCRPEVSRSSEDEIDCKTRKRDGCTYWECRKSDGELYSREKISCLECETYDWPPAKKALKMPYTQTRYEKCVNVYENERREDEFVSKKELMSCETYEWPPPGKMKQDLPYTTSIYRKCNRMNGDFMFKDELMICDWYLYPQEPAQISRAVSLPFSQCLYEECRDSTTGKFIRKDEKECYDMYKQNECVYKKITKDGQYVGKELVLCGKRNRSDKSKRSRRFLRR